MIEVPDRFLVYIREMPPLKKNGGKQMKDYNLVKWIANCKENCVAMVLIYRSIAEQAERKGWITYNRDTGIWQGVDYDGD